MLFWVAQHQLMRAQLIISAAVAEIRTTKTHQKKLFVSSRQS